MVRKILLIVCHLLIFSLSSLAQSGSPLTLLGDGETPVIEHMRSTRENRDYAYHEQYTDPGAIIYHEGQFHMFRNGFVGWPATVWIHYMVSDDGISWEQPSDEPILHTDDVPFADVAALASSVIVEDDGTWVLYFYTWNTNRGSFSDGEIGRATASNPEGPWTVYETPLLTLGDVGGFDERGVGAPQVIQTDDGYLMYYDGTDDGFDRRIGLATSDDGITWEKFANNPIFVPELEWEGIMTHQPRVIQIDDEFVMIYRTATGVSGGMRLGVATSSDGIAWERADEPILAPDMLEHHRAFWFNAVEVVDETFYLFIELTPASNTTDIFTMTAEVDTLLDW